MPILQNSWFICFSLFRTSNSWLTTPYWTYSKPKLRCSSSIYVVMGWTMFDRSKPKIGCSRFITNSQMNMSEYVWCSKNDVRVSWRNNSVNLVKALLGSMLVRLKPKIGCSMLSTNRWTRWSSVHVEKMMFEFVQCLIKWCLTHH